MERLIHRSRIDAPAQAVFEWHRRRGAFERLIPPWEAIRVDQSPILLAQGARAVLRVRIGPVWVRWLSRITEVEEGRGFADAQERGPFAAWEHAHRFLADGPRACWIEDDIRYRLPGGAAGSRLGGALARRRLERWMRYRHDVLAHDAPLALPATAGQPLRILLTGATGMVGRNLSCFLGALGHQVWPLRRDPSRRSAAPPAWDPDGGWIDLSGLPPLDAVVHLAGENISGRWTATRKERIRRSRIEGTRLLCGAIARLPERPRAMVMASGLGFYGDRGDQPMSESSGPGRGFLAELARDWEAAADAAREAGIRLAALRLSMVLWPGGGALEPLLRLFRLGLGGRVGGGTQYWSWITLTDLLGVVRHVLACDALDGPVNVASPQPVTNAEFTRVLARAVGRPAIFRQPAALIRLALGQMGTELLLTSTRAAPRRLEESGFRFKHPTLESALDHLLGLRAGGQ